MLRFETTHANLSIFIVSQGNHWFDKFVQNPDNHRKIRRMQSEIAQFCVYRTGMYGGNPDRYGGYTEENLIESEVIRKKT